MPAACVPLCRVITSVAAQHFLCNTIRLISIVISPATHHTHASYRLQLVLCRLVRVILLKWTVTQLMDHPGRFLLIVRTQRSKRTNCWVIFRIFELCCKSAVTAAAMWSTAAPAGGRRRLNTQLLQRENMSRWLSNCPAPGH